MKQYSGLTVQNEGPLAIITFDEVQLKLELLTKLALTIYELEADDEVKAVVITGRRNMFLSGADLKEFDVLTNSEIARKFIQIPRTLMEQIYDCSKMIVAAINGYCIGGGLELALVCDFRICVDRVLNFQGQSVPFIGLPEVGMGVVSPLGSSYLLPRIVGVARAKEIMLTADLIDAAKALCIGLVHTITPAEELMGEARRLAQRVIGNSMFSVKCAKRLINRSFDYSSLGEALLAEQEAFAACCDTAEKSERVGAKARKPRRVQTGDIASPVTPGADLSALTRKGAETYDQGN